MNNNIFRKALIWIMNTIAYNTKDTATVFTLFLAIWWGNELVNTDHVPIILAVLAIIFFYGPIFYLVSSVLLIIPKLVCLIILKLMKRREITGTDTTREMITSSKENQYKQQHDKSEDSSSYSYSSQDAKDSWKKTWKQAERKYQQQNSYSENQGNQKSYNQSGPNQQRKHDELQESLDFYGLTIPFTETVLREKRKKLIKEAHPDEGGSNERAADINRYFDVLKKLQINKLYYWRILLYFSSDM